MSDALGLPVRLIDMPGQRIDIALAHDLINGFASGAAMADKGYDADDLADTNAGTRAKMVIPPKRNRNIRCLHENIFITSVTLSIVSFASLSDSGASPPDMTSGSRVPSASSSSQPSRSGSKEQIVTTPAFNV